MPQKPKGNKVVFLHDWHNKIMVLWRSMINKITIAVYTSSISFLIAVCTHSHKYTGISDSRSYFHMSRAFKDTILRAGTGKSPLMICLSHLKRLSWKDKWKSVHLCLKIWRYILGCLNLGADNFISQMNSPHNLVKSRWH